MYKCVCTCGVECTVQADHLRSGNSKSCGCYARQRAGEVHTTHGHTSHGHRSPEYVSYLAMIDRCERPSASNYRRYGARAIRVCKRWRKSFLAFLADIGPRPDRSHTLHRLNNNKGYNRANVVWADPRTQARHRATTKLTENKAAAIRRQYEAGGVTEQELATRYGVSQCAISQVVTGRSWALMSAPKKPAASVQAASALAVA